MLVPPGPARVLVADDDASIRMLLRMLLEADGHTVVEAVDGPTALALMDPQLVDVALIDLQMPGLTGEQVLQAVARDGADLAIPILVVSGSDPSRGTLGLRLGAHDFISKPFDPDELLARVQAAHRVSSALRAGRARRQVISAQLSEAERLASTDELTGLANRRHLLRTLEQTADNAHRGHQPYGVILADVDGFKQINDRNGHRVGDELLQAVGLILARSTRVVDPPDVGEAMSSSSCCPTPPAQPRPTLPTAFARPWPTPHCPFTSRSRSESPAACFRPLR